MAFTGGTRRSRGTFKGLVPLPPPPPNPHCGLFEFGGLTLNIGKASLSLEGPFVFLRSPSPPGLVSPPGHGPAFLSRSRLWTVEPGERGRGPSMPLEPRQYLPQRRLPRRHRPRRRLPRWRLPLRHRPRRHLPRRRLPRRHLPRRHLPRRHRPRQHRPRRPFTGLELRRGRRMVFLEQESIRQGTLVFVRMAFEFFPFWFFRII